jgi:hypothetical protein
MTRTCGVLKFFKSTFLLDNSVPYLQLHEEAEMVCLSPDLKIRAQHYPPKKSPIPLERRPPKVVQAWDVWRGYTCREKESGSLDATIAGLSLEGGDVPELQHRLLIPNLAELLLTGPTEPIIVDEAIEPGHLPFWKLVAPRTWPPELYEMVYTNNKSRELYNDTLTASLKELVRPLMRTNDEVTFRISFGRLFINDTDMLMKRTDNYQRNYSESLLLQGLNTYFIPQGGDCLFTPILSTLESDAYKMLAAKTRRGVPMWVQTPASTSVWFEFRFFDRVMETFDCLISINSDTHEVKYRELAPTDGRIMVHNARKPWDFIVEGTRNNAAKTKMAFDADGRIGERLARTLSVT